MLKIFAIIFLVAVWIKGAINLDNLKQVKMCGDIVDYEIDEHGVKLIKKV